MEHSNLAKIKMSEILLELDPLLEELLYAEAKRLGITAEEFVVAEIERALPKTDYSNDSVTSVRE